MIRATTKKVSITALKRVIEDRLAKAVSRENTRRNAARPHVVKELEKWARRSSLLAKIKLKGLKVVFTHNLHRSYRCDELYSDGCTKVTILLTPDASGIYRGGNLYHNLELPKHLARKAKNVAELYVDRVYAHAELLASRVQLKESGADLEKVIEEVVQEWLTEKMG
jgi:hypothetical protein